MNIYKIKVDGKYLAGFTDDSVTTAPTGGWYDIGKDVKGLILVDDIEKAKAIEGNLNLNSYWKKIYDAIRYGNFQFNRIEIVRVEE